MSLQAIVTKFIGPTNTKGARIRVSAAAGRMFVNWDHALGVDGNHKAAAQALAAKFGWSGNWYGGSLPDDTGNAYVCAPFLAPEPAFIIESPDQ